MGMTGTTAAVVTAASGGLNREERGIGLVNENRRDMSAHYTHDNGTNTKHSDDAQLYLDSAFTRPLVLLCVRRFASRKGEE